MGSSLIVLVLAVQSAYLTEVTSSESFDAISRESRTRPDILRQTKFLAPASSAPELLPVVYQDVSVYSFHLDFMTTEFPDRFAGLELPEYRMIVQQRATRMYFAGSILQLRDRDGELLYGFDFYTDQASDDELPRPEEVEWVLQKIAATFSLRPLVYAPVRSDVIEHARSWADVSFDIYTPDSTVVTGYSAYTTGTAYGRPRFLTPAEVIEASRSGTLTSQDILVARDAPTDLTVPVAAVVTGTPQTELSHLNLRLAQRGTPNAFLADLDERLGEFEDALVRIDLEDRTLSVTHVEDISEAEAWWSTHRPRLPSLPDFDLDAVEPASFEEIANDPEATARYGAKAANTALLRTVLPHEHVVDGFAIPLSWYERFLRESRLLDAASLEIISYAEYLERLQTSEEFRTDAAFRINALEEFVERAQDHGTVPGELVATGIGWIAETFGDPTARVRFRSSSNMEDIIPFNGAGLYLSTSACAADSLDDDGDGPSRCDPEEENERSLERALRRVWSSIWLPRAYNERDFWQAPHDRAKMGVLVTPTFVDEAANGVVLSGNPALPGDDRIVINVQPGENSVVHPDPGVLPERVVVEVDGGVATRVDRVRPSSLSPEGEWVLSIDEARELGELVQQAAAALAPRFETPLGDVLFDFEFKLIEAGESRRIVFKQVRPFLRESAGETDTLALVVPAATSVCGVFQKSRSLDQEHEFLSTAKLVPGRLELPGAPGTIEVDLFEELLVGPARTPATPQAPGELSCEVFRVGTRTEYECSYRQEWLVDSVPLVFDFRLPLFYADSDGPDRLELVLDDEALDSASYPRGHITTSSGSWRMVWSSCEYASLPRYGVDVATETGESAHFEWRLHRPPVGTGPANIVLGEVVLEDEHRLQNSYWDLVYAAEHHNWNQRFRILLRPPIGDVHAVDLHEQKRDSADPPMFRLLDGDMNVLRELVVTSWETRRLQDEADPDFVRGDANTSGSVNVADAITVLTALFGDGEPLGCLDAADADDDGKVNLTDAIRVLLFLFGGGDGYEPPSPGPWQCGKDRGADALRACEYPIGVCADAI